MPDPEKLESKGTLGYRGNVSGHDVRIGVREFYPKRGKVQLPKTKSLNPHEKALIVTVDGHFVTHIHVRREIDERLVYILDAARKHALTLALPSAIYQELGVSHPALASDSACSRCTVQIDNEGMFRSRKEPKPLVRIRLCDDMGELQEADLPAASKDALWHFDDLLRQADCSRRLVLITATVVSLYIVIGLFLAITGTLTLTVALIAHLATTIVAGILVHTRADKVCAILTP
jgi:cation transport ATPase